MMADISTVQMLFLVWCTCFTGLSSARSVQLSRAEDDVSAVKPYDVRCDVAGCEYDLQLYCLDNGVILMGSCSLKNTLCRNGQRNSLKLANSWDSCFLATYSIIFSDKAHADEQPGPGPETRDVKGEEAAVMEEAREMEGKEAEHANLPGRGIMDTSNLQLEQDLLTDPKVKVNIGRGQGTEVKVDEAKGHDSKA